MITRGRVGLESSQVRELTQQGKVNVQIDRTAKTTKDIIKENVFTYFNLIFLIISLLLMELVTLAKNRAMPWLKYRPETAAEKHRR